MLTVSRLGFRRFRRRVPAAICSLRRQRRVLRVGAVDHHDRADVVAEARVVALGDLPAVARRARGLIVTRSAPAPLIVTSRMIIRPLVPTPPPPSTYVARADRDRVARSARRRSRSGSLVYGAAGQSCPSSSTVSVAAPRCRRRDETPSAANAAATDCVRSRRDHLPSTLFHEPSRANVSDRDTGAATRAGVEMSQRARCSSARSCPRCPVRWCAG